VKLVNSAIRKIVELSSIRVSFDLPVEPCSFKRIEPRSKSRRLGPRERGDGVFYFLDSRSAVGQFGEGTTHTQLVPDRGV
jgi:hypothetical protein